MTWKGPHILTIKIPGEFVDLNTYINAERSNRFIGAKIKKEETERVAWETKKYKNKIKEPVWMRFDWFTKNERKDPDNVAFSKKFIFDGMVDAGVMEGDTRKFVSGFEDYFHTDKKDPHVEIRFFQSIPHMKF